MFVYIAERTRNNLHPNPISKICEGGMAHRSIIYGNYVVFFLNTLANKYKHGCMWLNRISPPISERNCIYVL